MGIRNKAVYKVEGFHGGNKGKWLRMEKGEGLRVGIRWKRGGELRMGKCGKG